MKWRRARKWSKGPLGFDDENKPHQYESGGCADGRADGDAGSVGSAVERHQYDVDKESSFIKIRTHSKTTLTHPLRNRGTDNKHHTTSHEFTPSTNNGHDLLYEPPGCCGYPRRRAWIEGQREEYRLEGRPTDGAVGVGEETPLFHRVVLGGGISIVVVIGVVWLAVQWYGEAGGVAVVFAGQAVGDDVVQQYGFCDFFSYGRGRRLFFVGNDWRCCGDTGSFSSQ